MARRIATIAMTLSDQEGQFCSLKPSWLSHGTSRNSTCFVVCLHADSVCDL